jgi:hypothetical protein
MASTINAISGGAGGLTSKGDASGALNIQTAGTTAIAIDASQNVTFSGGATIVGTLTANIFASGQTWQNVTGSRAFSTNYTNSTSKPIMVCLFVGQASGIAYATVDSIQVGGSANATTSAISFVVPVGSVYKLTGISIFSWAELR